jgi:hypothetical protein
MQIHYDSPLYQENFQEEPSMGICFPTCCKPSPAPANFMPAWTSRHEEMQNRIREVARRMGMSNHATIPLIRNPDCVVGFGMHSDGVGVCVPDLMMIKPQDVPPHLRLGTMHDPRLQDNRYIEEVTDWVKRHLGINQPLNASPLMIKYTIKQFLKYLSNPDLAERGIDFVIHHEVAHLYYQHHDKRSLFCDKMIRLSLLLKVCVVGFICAALGIAFPGSSYLFTLRLAGSVIGMKKSSDAFQRHHRKKVCRAQEKEADLLAARISGNGKGGAYRFERYRLDQLALRNHPALGFWGRRLAQKLIDERGNNLQDYDHPPLTERIEYLNA